ncbi:unnamed protein product [Auanema sp. JU1783]|nr:unnamed protein product [Auanema sp. JU1783]
MTEASKGARISGFGFGSQKRSLRRILHTVNKDSADDDSRTDRSRTPDRSRSSRSFNSSPHFKSNDEYSDSGLSNDYDPPSSNDFRDRGVSFNSYLNNINRFLNIVPFSNPPHAETLNLVRGPLGVCFDEEKKEWIIADSINDRIILYPSSYEISVDNIECPTAVCTFEPGKSVALLCKKTIVIFHYDTRQCDYIYTDDININCRGLGRTPGGNVVTIHRKRSNAEISIFDSVKHNTCLGSFVFENNADCNPSFLDMVGDKLVISDLGQQKIFMCRLDDTDVNNIVFDIIATHTKVWSERNLEPEGGFAYVSGVQLDRDGNVIVADARGRTFQFFDSRLNFLHRLQVDIAMPYVSSFYINTHGHVLMCDRRANRMILAKLKATSSVSPLSSPWPTRNTGGYTRGRNRRNQQYNR